MDNLVDTLRRMRLEDAFAVACAKGWLSQQSAELQQALMSRAKLRYFPKEKYIYHMEDEGSELFCIIDGVIVVSIAHPLMGMLNGHILLPGDWFGEVATLAKGERMVTMQARLPTLVMALGRKAIDEIILANPQCSYAFFDIFRLNTQVAMRSSIDLLIQDPKMRLCARMLTLCGARSGDFPIPPVDIPFTQEELALTSCLSRKTVHQLLNEFVKRGICELHYRRISVLNVRALAGIISGP